VSGAAPTVGHFALVATLEFEPDVRAEILAALLAHRARCLAEEPGTLQFEVLAPHDEPGRLLLYELYTDAAAFAAHGQGASIARYRDEVRGKLTRITSHKCALGHELA